MNPHVQKLKRRNDISAEEPSIDVKVNVWLVNIIQNTYKAIGTKQLRSESHIIRITYCTKCIHQQFRRSSVQDVMTMQTKCTSHVILSQQSENGVHDVPRHWTNHWNAFLLS